MFKNSFDYQSHMKAINKLTVEATIGGSVNPTQINKVISLNTAKHKMFKAKEITNDDVFKAMKKLDFSTKKKLDD